MSTKIVNAADARVIPVDDAMTVFDYFTEADGDEVSLVTADLDGIHSNRVNHRSVKLYFVISGKLRVISDGVEREVGPLSGVRVPAGTWVKLVGENAKVAIICGPAFNPADESFEA
ncbi:hypothetical protein ACH4U7_33620 [Streptomyces sp. NPDC020845]|uniref:hypothetical protein n=1 Tax=Streptomyces sp. NPDC020845 TaxID=3365096 RepID=UPI00379B1AAE